MEDSEVAIDREAAAAGADSSSVKTALGPFPHETGAPTDERKMAKKRSYRRRSDDERIAELESKIDGLKEKIALRERQDSPVLQDIPKVRRRLHAFAQLAIDNGRDDLSNMTVAFLAGLERIADEAPPSETRRGRRG